MKKNKGFTLIEMIVVVIILAVITPVLVHFYGKIGHFFLKASMQSQLEREGQETIEVIVHLLNQAQPRTMTVSAGPMGGLASQVDFRAQDNTAYRFWLQADPDQGGDVYFKNVTNGHTSVLTHNAVSLSFYYPDSTDNSVMGLGLKMQRIAGKTPEVVMLSRDTIRLTGNP